MRRKAASNRRLRGATAAGGDHHQAKAAATGAAADDLPDDATTTDTAAGEEPPARGDTSTETESDFPARGGGGGSGGGASTGVRPRALRARAAGATAASSGTADSSPASTPPPLRRRRKNNANNNNNSSNNSSARSSLGSLTSLSPTTTSGSGGASLSPSAALRDGRGKPTLVLDLDETLIHSTTMGSRHHDHMIEVLVEKHVCLYYVYKRPHVDYFLKKVSEWYKVVIFTASMPEYADPVIDWLDKNRTLISKRYFRQSCTPHGGYFAKNLAIVEPDLSQVCLLDNSALSYALNQENGIPIESWTNDPTDAALLDILPFLDALRFTDDLRSILALRVVDRSSGGSGGGFGFGGGGGGGVGAGVAGRKR
ncbi:HAD-like domain-containing protein [Zopfochytrium polystomum]|nr:HAD-like domain-containing protein [Zopfochytrium polystomum]